MSTERDKKVFLTAYAYGVWDVLKIREELDYSLPDFIKGIRFSAENAYKHFIKSEKGK